MRVASKEGNLPYKFGHARPLGSRIIRYVHDGRTDRWTGRQTDTRTDGQKQRLLPPSLRGRGHNKQRGRRVINATVGVSVVWKTSVPTQRGPSGTRRLLPATALSGAVPARGRLQGVLRVLLGTVPTVRLPADVARRSHGGTASFSAQVEDVGRRQATPPRRATHHVGASAQSRTVTLTISPSTYCVFPFNRLEIRGNYNATIILSWYTGRWWAGCYIWYSEEGTGRGPSPPRPFLAVPNVTAHPSTASVPVTVLLCNSPLLCSFNVGIKGG